ncbi:hypothetical protein RB195_007308 [Necator americanus]
MIGHVHRFLHRRIGAAAGETLAASSSQCLSGRHCTNRNPFRTMFHGVSVHTVATKDSPNTPYEAAILLLNSLQSNAANLQKIREKRGLLQETNIPDMISKLNMCGIELDTLDSLNVIHISGTKGKGSTCAFVESILRKAGLRTGMYTSPHLVHVRERIRINGKAIGELLFAKYFFDVYNKLKQEVEGDMPPYFKFLTLLSFHVFLEECVDVAIVEVGIGGEYDATNVVVHPVVCGISTLDIDHTSLLGATLPEIAWHKAGILKKSCPAVVSPLCQDAVNVVLDRASERETSVKNAPPYQSYSFATECVSTGIAGDHQKVNISLALQLARTWLKQTGREAVLFPDANKIDWKIGEPFLVSGPVVEAIESCRWRGRSQIVDVERTRYYLDGAHTPKSMKACSNWFGQAAVKNSRKKRVLVFHCTGDRNPSTLLPVLSKHGFDFALFCPTALTVFPDIKSDLTNFNQSAVDQRKRSQQCASIWKDIATGEVLVFDCITSTVKWIESLSRKEYLDVLVTGSLHLVGGVLSIIEPNAD